MVGVGVWGQNKMGDHMLFSTENAVSLNVGIGSMLQALDYHVKCSNYILGKGGCN